MRIQSWPVQSVTVSRLLQRRGLLLVVVLALLVLAELLGIQSLRDEMAGMRPPDRFDLFYRFMAQELNAPLLCRKISWSVRDGTGMDDAASYERSECYATIAGNMGNPWLCWSVKRLGAVDLLRHQTSMWSCMARALRHEHSGIAMPQGELVEIFSQMGYDPDRLQTEGVTPAMVQVKALYRGLTERVSLRTRSADAGGDEEVRVPGSMDQGLLLRRIEGLIGPPGVPLRMKDGKAADGAYLADMAAMMTKDWRWCSKIAAGPPLTPSRGEFRDWCLLKVATETRDAAVCGRMSEAAGGGPGASLAADCRRQAGSPHVTGTHYGPEVPADDAQTRALLGMLKVEIPRAKDLPEERIYDAYMQFVQALSQDRQDATHAAARRRLIGRVEELPGN